MTDHFSEPINGRRVLRAVVKAICLFVLFNACYFIGQPVQSARLPTLYNTVVPGRTRLVVGNEFGIRRLLADHVIQTARPDRYNIIVLGSSEIWGATTKPSGTIPAYLDQLGLVAADGRPVSIYNLSYPGPEILKDFMIWEAVHEENLPIDLVILTVNGGAFGREIEHQLLTENGAYVKRLLAHYKLNPAMLIGTAQAARTFFWQDRQSLAAWFLVQLYSARWIVTGEDRSSTPIAIARTQFLTDNVMAPITRSEVLDAFVDSTSQADVAVLILSVPIAAVKHPFEAWIIKQTADVSLPLLNCVSVLKKPSLFEGSVHLMPEAHPIFARILAHSLGQPTLQNVDAGLPLSLPNVAMQDEPLCMFYPALRTP